MNKTQFGKVLEIIGYIGDKDELFGNFFGLCYFNAIADLIETLPEEKREEAKKEIFETKELQQTENIKKYFNETQVTDALKKASEKIFSDYYNSIKPSLSESQINQLGNYLSTIVPQQA